jgi:hypothetical protein
MKKTLTTLLLALALASCTTIKQTSQNALDKLRTGADVGFATEKIDQGYQISGHASTNVFGIEPYGSFKAGIKYAPQDTVEPVLELPLVEASK